MNEINYFYLGVLFDVLSFDAYVFVSLTYFLAFNQWNGCSDVCIYIVVGDKFLFMIGVLIDSFINKRRKSMNIFAQVYSAMYSVSAELKTIIF